MGRDERVGLGAVVLAVVVLLIVGTLLDALVTTPAGHVRVVTEFGRVTGRVLTPGLSVKTPFIQGTVKLSTQETVYETAPAAKVEGDKSQADYVDYQVDTNTSDGQRVDVAFSVKYAVDKDMAPWVVENLGGQNDVNEKIVKFHSRILARMVPRGFTAAELYTGDGVERAQSQIAERLQEEFAPKGVRLIDFGIREVAFEQDYMDAVEQKQIEKERVTAEEYKAEQAEWQKKATITEAEGEAEAIKIKAAALKDNPDIVELRFVEVLAEQNIEVMILPSNMLPFLNLGQ